MGAVGRGGRGSRDPEPTKRTRGSPIRGKDPFRGCPPGCTEARPDRISILAQRSFAPPLGCCRPSESPLGTPTAQFGGAPVSGRSGGLRIGTRTLRHREPPGNGETVPPSEGGPSSRLRAFRERCGHPIPHPSARRSAPTGSCRGPARRGPPSVGRKGDSPPCPCREEVGPSCVSWCSELEQWGASSGLISPGRAMTSS